MKQPSLLESLGSFYGTPQPQGKLVGQIYIQGRSLPCECGAKMLEAVAYRRRSNKHADEISILGRVCWSCRKPDRRIDLDAFLALRN
jgi:hypothetical protein